METDNWTYSPGEEALLSDYIEKGVHWVKSQKKAHRSVARRLTPAERSAVGSYFTPRLLAAARIRRIPVIKPPEFVDDLSEPNMPALLNFPMASGMTFDNTIVISRRFVGEDSIPPALLFHELVHVVQYDFLGVTEFVARYVRGWMKNRMDYYAIPLEVDAFRLEKRFIENRRAPFSVAAEVLFRLKGRKSQ